LAKQAIKGNLAAQKQIYGLYAKAMFNICVRLMNNYHDAEDMLQESFSDVFKKLETFRFESTLGAWIKQITIHKCINELKRRKAQLEYHDTLSNYDENESEHYNDSEALEPDYSVDKIRHAMALLPDGYRTVFSLYLMEGYDHEEIASIIGISESTSKTQLMRAKKKLIEIINLGNSTN